MYQNQVRRASFKQNWAFYVQFSSAIPIQQKLKKEKKTSESDWKTFFSFKFIKNTLWFCICHLSKFKKSTFCAKQSPKKLKKNDVFKYSCWYEIYSKEILMQVIYSFVIINLNKNEHFLCNRIILVMKVLLPANTYCNQFHRSDNVGLSWK